MNIPSIGGTRGIFEIFVPGVFLLLNLVITVYLFPFIDQETQDLIATSTASDILMIALGVVFGYLTGMLLRLLPPNLPDHVSAWLLRRFHRKRSLALSDEFPYFDWINHLCDVKQHLSSMQGRQDSMNWSSRSLSSDPNSKAGAGGNSGSREYGRTRAPTTCMMCCLRLPLLCLGIR